MPLSYLELERKRTALKQLTYLKEKVKKKTKPTNQQPNSKENKPLSVGQRREYKQGSTEAG